MNKRSNLSKEDYRYLINKANILDYSYMSITIGKLRGEIRCDKIRINEPQCDINGVFEPAKYIYRFELTIDNINEEYLCLLVEQHNYITIDNIKYYLANYRIDNMTCNKYIMIRYVGYYHYTEEEIKEGLK